jgi:hypothetical protein
LVEGRGVPAYARLDLAGNGLVGPVGVAFSTGGSIATGRIRGEVIGMPSTPASDPTGALVAATTDVPFGDDPDIVGAGAADATGDYSVDRLTDDTYYLISVLDSNGDGRVDPESGDALGVYGVVDFENDLPDSVMVAGGGTVTGADIQLFDPTSISGLVTYEGTMYRDGEFPVYIGVFDTTAFDPTSTPDHDRTGTWPYDLEFAFSTIDDGLVAGTYYVGAFLDVNSTGLYEPLTDPAGLYGGASPVPVTLADGEDAMGLIVRTDDPGALATPLPGGAWASAPTHARAAALVRWAADVVRAANGAARWKP